jgi:hypothetical protein
MNQGRARLVGGHCYGLPCRRAIHSDTDRPARTRCTFASICKGCSRKHRKGRCRGLSGCFRTSSRSRRRTREEPSSRASYPPGSPGFFELALELLYEPGNPRAVILRVRRLVVQIKSVIKNKRSGSDAPGSKAPKSTATTPKESDLQPSRPCPATRAAANAETRGAN